MAESYFVNAAPMVLDQGADDKSIRQVPLTPLAKPQHFPLSFIYAKKGPEDLQAVDSAARERIYGSDSFDLRKKWANHVTVFSNEFAANGNYQMIKRLKPTDAGPDANITVWIDVLSTSVPQYQRNPDGTYTLDVNGNKIPTGASVPGFQYNFTTTTQSASLALGSEVAGVGALSAGSSTKTPLFTFKASSFGAWALDVGVRPWGISDNIPGGIDHDILTKALAYPFRLAVINRKDSSSTARTVSTIRGDQNVVLTLKPGCLDPNTTQRLYLGDAFVNQYNNITDPRYPAVYGDIGEVYVFQNNIDTILAQFLAAEITQSAMYPDINPASTEDQKYLINLFGGTSSYGEPYYALEKVTGSVPMTANSNIWLQSGSDGTMNYNAHADLVEAEMELFTDSNNIYCDSAWNPATVIYDSGYRLSTKLSLFKCMSNRKDMCVIAGLHDASSQSKLTSGAENSLAVTVRSAAQLFPESDFFGTPCSRVLIQGRSGLIRNSNWYGRMPLTFELARKFSRYMGASEGRWKSEYRPDGTPGSIVEAMHDINVTWTGPSVRNSDWDAGMNWVQTYDRRRNFIPSYKTVYTDDTSIMNSAFTMFALCTLNRLAYEAWRDMSGIQYLSAGQLSARLNAYIIERTNGIFDERFVVVPDAQVTAMDTLRGYSFFLNIKLYGNNMRTVMTTRTTTYRLEDLVVQG